MKIKCEELVAQVIQKVTKKKTKIFLHKPYLDTNDQDTVKKTIKLGEVSTYGKTTQFFENEIKKYTKSKYVVAVNSGTSALQLSIIASGIKENEEVLIPALNFIASSNAVIYNSSIPHYIDCDYDLGVNIIELDKYLSTTTKIKKNKCINIKTGRVIRAIIPTHIFGRVNRIAELQKICKKFNLILIEDASEAFGTFFKKKHAGTFGVCGAISFNGNKIITSGGGGAILTRSKKIYNLIKHLATVSKKEENNSAKYDEVGYNYKMPSLNAALGISQIKKIRLIKKYKYYNYLQYKNLFLKNKDFYFLINKKNTESNHWLNCIIFKNQKILDKKFFDSFKKKKIEIRKIWSLNNKGNYYKKYPKMKLRVSNYLEKRIICLPSGVFK